MVKMATDQEVSAVPVEEEAPLNFSELTPHQFGISTESFIPTSSNRKDKSRLAQIKARRRSSVGVRGSPETNSLIRFRAQQRMKTPPSSHSLELVMSSPFTLRQKMASFRSLMDVEESDACDPLPVQNNDTGGCIFTQDYLSGKENNPPTSPASGKKRRLGPLKGCSVEIREDDISVCHSGLKDQEEAPCKHQSPDRPPSDGPSAASPAQQSHLPHIPSLPSMLEMKPTVDVDRTPAGKKKKQVRFGVPLSPEFFDKNLPPSTPLQKGGTPARAATPGGGLELRSVLKTPQRSESETQQNQPEPLCPAGFGASPTFAMPHRRRPSNEGGDWEDGKIVYPSMEEIDSAVLSDAECYFDAQPLNLNMAFHEESLSQTLNGDSEPTGTPQMDTMEGRECVAEDKPPEGDAGSQTLTQSKSRRRKKKEEDSDSELRSRPDSRKRKANCLFAEQLEDSEPVKRSARSAAKAACRKMKGASTAARSWSKDVDRSLYGSRAYASKNPALSPITERRSFIGPSPSSERTPDGSTGCDIFEVASGAPNSEDFAEAVEVSTYDDVRPPTCSPGTDSRRPRSADRRGRKKKEQIDVGLCRADPEEPSEILCTDSNTYNVGLLTLDEESIPESEQRQGKQREQRRSTVPLEPEHKEEGTGEMEQGDARSSSGQQGEVEGPNVDLAPWQADFNFEDVFKSVNPRRERSVRRSLRNRANSENSSVGGGLAWVPHTSPDSVRETRRRTRQRRLSAALLPPEETRDSASTELSEQ